MLAQLFTSTQHTTRDCHILYGTRTPHVNPRLLWQNYAKICLLIYMWEYMAYDWSTLTEWLLLGPSHQLPPGRVLDLRQSCKCELLFHVGLNVLDHVSLSYNMCIHYLLCANMIMHASQVTNSFQFFWPFLSSKCVNIRYNNKPQI